MKITSTMPLKYNNGIYELTLPTMVAERFQSQGAPPVGSSGRLWNPPEDRDGQSLRIEVLLETGFPITGLSSPTHPLTVSQAETIRQILIGRDVLEESAELSMPHSAGTLLQEADTYPNRDFVLRFSRASADRDVSVASYFDWEASRGYFFATLFPDSGMFEQEKRSAMQVVLLVDHSGSQSGWPLIKEKEIASMILDRLESFDKFAVLAFNTTVSWCFEPGESVEATSENIAVAKNFINGLAATGGTDLLAGVQSALSSKSGEGLDPYFVFLTDGFITNESAIFEAIRTNSSPPTVFTFGAGNNLNRYFLEESARVGNGYASEVTEHESVEKYVNDAWNKIESPQLRDVTLGFSGRVPEDVLMPLGNRLYKGFPLVVYGTYSQEGGACEITVTGKKDDETVSFSKEITLASYGGTGKMIPQVWARQMIRKLRLEEGATAANKDRIIELSLDFQVLSDYTAFLAHEPTFQLDREIGASGMGTIGSKLSVQDGYAGPNLPKNPAGTIEVRCIPGMLTIRSGQEEWIREIAIYDLKGRCVYRLKKLPLDCAGFRWDGTTLNGLRIPSGQYLVKVMTVNATLTRMVAWR